MKEWLIASSLAMAGGGAYYSGVFDSADIVRTVDKPPSAVYDGFAVVLNDHSPFLYDLAYLSPDPKKVAEVEDVEFDVTSEKGKYIDYRLTLKDQPLVHVRVDFEPLDGGAKTKVKADIDVINVPAMEGEPDTPVAPGGELGVKLALNILMNGLIDNIENGKLAEWDNEMIRMRGELLSRPEYAERRLSADRARREAKASDASAPTLDVDEAAVRPSGTSARPMVDVSR